MNETSDWTNESIRLIRLWAMWRKFDCRRSMPSSPLFVTASLLSTNNYMNILLKYMFFFQNFQKLLIMCIDWSKCKKTSWKCWISSYIIGCFIIRGIYCFGITRFLYLSRIFIFEKKKQSIDKRHRIRLHKLSCKLRMRCNRISPNLKHQSKLIYLVNNEILIAFFKNWLFVLFDI